MNGKGRRIFTVLAVAVLGGFDSVASSGRGGALWWGCQVGAIEGSKPGSGDLATAFFLFLRKNWEWEVVVTSD